MSRSDKNLPYAVQSHGLWQEHHNHSRGECDLPPVPPKNSQEERAMPATYCYWHWPYYPVLKDRRKYKHGWQAELAREKDRRERAWARIDVRAQLEAAN